MELYYKTSKDSETGKKFAKLKERDDECYKAADDEEYFEDGYITE